MRQRVGYQEILAFFREDWLAISVSNEMVKAKAEKYR